MIWTTYKHYVGLVTVESQSKKEVDSVYKPDNENIKKINFYANNKWNIPVIQWIKEFDKNIEFIGFNYAKTFEKVGKTNYGIHFFLDDYQFNRLWNNPNKYLELLSKFKYILSPDFSMYCDYPKAMQMWKHYQKHWIGAYLELLGITVIPTIGWSDEESFKWCFDGEPKNSVVAVSSIGTQRYEESMQLFLKGYAEMKKRLKPKQVLFWGNIPKELEEETNIIHMGYIMDEKFKLMRENSE